MEPTHKKSDCYFFFYSTCIKGDNCSFRHEPSALGCEIMCSYWQQGNCLNEHCNFRHMELKKNRKSIQCFWETQRSGCKKPHCPFMHLGARPAPNPDATNPIKTAEVTSKPVTQEWSNRPDDGKFDGSGTESDQGRGSSEAGSFIGSPAVDPLIVNFDEESDNESVPSPAKRRPARVPYCKTYEEIRLEEIQAESAAYYSYEPDDYLGSIGGGKQARISSLQFRRRTSSPYSRERPNTIRLTRTKINTGSSPPSDFTVLSLDEIRRRKAATLNATKSSGDSSGIASRVKKEEKESPAQTTSKEPDHFLRNAIKTLAELKAVNVAKIPTVRISRKRSIETAELDPNNDDSDASKMSKSSKVPPVRLRRLSKRLSRSEMIDEATNTQSNENYAEAASVRDSSNPRTAQIEVRVCDSSTSDEPQPQVASEILATKSRDEDEGKHAALAIPDDIKLKQLCDTDLSPNDDDEYLTISDPASDDILKDIDALLTEKSTV